MGQADTPMLRCPKKGHAASSGSSPATEFLEAARWRLGLLALVLAAPAVALAIVDAVLVHALGKPPITPDPDGIVIRARLAIAAISVATFVATRTHVFPCDKVLTLGLAYEVLGAFFLSFRSYWGDLSSFAHHSDLVTFNGVWVVLFPLVVPVKVGRAAVAAFGAAITGPLVQWLWLEHSGSAWPEPITFARVYAPLFVCALLAVLTSQLVYGLGKSIAAARSESRDLGSYRLVEKLGSGGMGEVWRAEHRMLARPAAVKLIRPELLSSESASDRSATIARFEREAQATAELKSPHTVSLYDYGVSEDGTLYYVMELLPGIDLESLVTRFGPLPPARVVHLLMQACESLAEAHAHGLIHRDVKPANLYLCRLGVACDVIKVLDFGLVGHARQQSNGAGLTGSGFIVGTPRYMSPEQAQGKPLDERSDIYALACVAYWLLTGSPPFTGDSAGGLIADHIKTQPDPPSKRLGKPLPESLETLLLACLEKDPKRRPLDAWSLLKKLEACDVGEPWRADDARVWWDNHLKEISGPMPKSTALLAPTVLTPARVDAAV